MFFIILTFFAALFIEGLGSLVSVIGISALFGANPIIIALAIALDVGKVVTVSLLYTYWKSLSKLMKGYALLAATVTMIITSAGAAGYLTGEFQKSIMGTKEGDLKVAVMKEQQAKYELRKKQIDDQIAALPSKTTVNQRLRLMNGFKAEQKELDTKIAQIDKDLPELQVKQIGTEAKAGPIVAISKALNVPMEEAVSYVIALIIVVFDPLAIFLIISGNFLWARRKAEKLEAEKQRRPTEEYFKEPEVPVEVPTPIEPEVFIQPAVEPTPAVEPPVKMFDDQLRSDFPESPTKDQVFFHTGLGLLYIYDGERWIAANTISFPLDPTPVPEPVETVYEKYEEPTVEPVPEPIEEPVVEPEPVVEEPVEEPIVRATYEPTGLLKPVNVEPPDDVETKIDDAEFIPMKVEPREEITLSSLGIVTPDPATVVDAHRSTGFRPAASKK